MAEKKIKQCPLCGSNDIVQKYFSNYSDPSEWITCKRCGVSIRRNTKNQVIEAWNTRFNCEKRLNTLFCAVQWLNNNPILDGMKYFETKETCLEYINSIPEYKEFDVRYTVIRLEKEDS